MPRVVIQAIQWTWTGRCRRLTVRTGTFAAFPGVLCMCAVMRTMFEGADTTVAALQRPRRVHEPLALGVVIGMVDVRGLYGPGTANLSIFLTVRFHIRVLNDKTCLSCAWLHMGSSRHEWDA